MEYLLINKTKIYLDPVNEQISPLGRPFRLSGITKDLTVEPIFKDKMWFHATTYTFRYTDDDDGFFSFYFDANNNFKHKS